MLQEKIWILFILLPRELGRKIVKAEEIRHASDYDTFYIASKEITAQQIETSEKILELARKTGLITLMGRIR